MLALSKMCQKDTQSIFIFLDFMGLSTKSSVNPRLTILREHYTFTSKQLYLSSSCHRIPYFFQKRLLLTPFSCTQAHITNGEVHLNQANQKHNIYYYKYRSLESLKAKSERQFLRPDHVLLCQVFADDLLCVRHRGEKPNLTQSLTLTNTTS